MWTVEDFKKTYRNFDDSKIKELALRPNALRKDVIPILKEEIKRRNLDVSITEWVNNEINYFEGLERQNLIRKIAKSKCSSCSVNSGLDGYRFNTIISLLFVITDKTEARIICTNCAKNKRFSSMATTFFLGWWSKRGLFSTPVAFISDFIKIFRKQSESKKVYDEFIDNNTGTLRTGLQTEDGLNEVLAKFNEL